jgi:hypothetical protein
MRPEPISPFDDYRKRREREELRRQVIAATIAAVLSSSLAGSGAWLWAAGKQAATAEYWRLYAMGAAQKESELILRNGWSDGSLH